jgi:BirA family biotin operon repressor/biotin-[acetyl-CoA-carboxylase] ligase
MRALLRRLNRDYDEIGTRGADGILAQWRARSETLGRAVQVSTASETIEGVAYDVDETGALLVRTHGSADRRIVAGDVTGEVEAGVP